MSPQKIISKISSGDIVEQIRHYDFENDKPVLVDGPEEENKGTKWKVIKVGKNAMGQSYVELELIEGEHKVKSLNFRTGDVTFEVLHPGYTAKLTNSPNYDEYFPSKGQFQQFYDEWEVID